jgi:rabenosyn-5
MLPLKTLPKILKHATPHGRTPNGHLSPALPSTPNGRPTSALTSIRFNDTIETSSQVTTTSNSSAVSALEAEEKSLRERLIVLEEQKFLVSEMIADANKRRKFDEVASLAVNVEDLGKEIDAVNGMLGQLDFAGVYGGNGAIGTAGEKK